MPSSFHRLVAATYFGGMPGTHDFINNPAGNGDPGSVALADGKKSSGVNEGTYFIAFGEGATSFHTNRLGQALSQNTDYLDDVVHRDIASPTLVGPFVGPNGSMQLAGDVYVGDFGTLTSQPVRSSLVTLVDDNGVPLHVDTGGGTFAPILVSAITSDPGGLFNVVGTAADGFYTNPYVTFSIPVPAAQAYSVGFKIRSNLTSLTTGLFASDDLTLLGTADLWAYTKTTRLGLVVFSGAKTFDDAVGFNDLVTFNDDATFNDPAIFNDDVTFNDPTEFNADATFNNQVLSYDVIQLLNPDLAEERILSDIAPATNDFLLIQKTRYTDAPTATYARTFASNEQTTPSRLGLAISINAHYNPLGDTWSADDDTEPATLVIFSSATTRWLYRAVTTGTWATSGWTGYTAASATGDVVLGGGLRALGDVRADDLVAAVDVLAANDVTAGGDVLAGGDFLYSAPSGHRVTLPLTEGVSSSFDGGTSEWVINILGALEWQLVGGVSATVSFPIRVPRNYMVTEVRVLIDRAGGNVPAYWYKTTGIVWTFGSEDPGTVSLVDSGSTSGAADTAAVILTGSETLDTTDEFYTVVVVGVTVGDKIEGVSYVFTDEGPKNH